MDIVIVDDEMLARQRLERMLEKIECCRVIGQAENGEQALALVHKLDPDIVLLDVHMPGIDGIEAGKQLAALDNPPVIIYCTAYDEHALDAFKVNAVDYLMKPVSQEQLLTAIEKAGQLNRLQKNDQVVEQVSASEQREHITAKSRRGVELIAIEDVRCFMADQKYVTVHYCTGEILIDDTLKELEQEFPERFIRVHRNALISLPHVQAMERCPEGGYRLRLQDLELKPQVSRRHVSEIKKRLEKL